MGEVFMSCKHVILVIKTIDPCVVGVILLLINVHKSITQVMKSLLADEKVEANRSRTSAMRFKLEAEVRVLLSESEPSPRSTFTSPLVRPLPSPNMCWRLGLDLNGLGLQQWTVFFPVLEVTAVMTAFGLGLNRLGFCFDILLFFWAGSALVDARPRSR
ncbi:hypothetical protein FOZ62_000522, partial [Perkinsus olseni]